MQKTFEDNCQIESLSRAGFFARLYKDIKGVTAIEFSMLAFPFFLLVFAIIESSLFFFSTQYLETAVDNVTRKMRTGILNENTTQDIFREALCDEILILFDCSRIRTDVTVATTFAGLAPSTVEDDGEFEENFDPIGPQQIIQVTATYLWPVYTNYASPLRFGNTNSALIHVTSVTRSEPYFLTPTN